jgi:hypothetical protein
MKIGGKSGKATTKVKKTTKPETIVARQIAGLANLEYRRVLVADQAMFRDLRESIERIGNHTDNEKARSYAEKVAKHLGEMANHFEFLQSFVPNASPGDAAPSSIDEALSVIEYAALEHVSELIGAIEITCQSALVIGYELASDPRSLPNIKKFQKEQAKRAREARAIKIAASKKEQALKTAIEKHLPQPSGRDYKDANSILDSVNEDLENRGLCKVNVDKIRRWIKKHRAL